MKCPVCGRKNFDTNNFCYNCGYCMNSSLKSLKRMKRDKTAFLAGIILLALIAIGLAGVIVFYGLKYRQLISDNNGLKSEYEQLQSDYDDLDSIVYVPDDWSFVYHKYDCKEFDHDIACYVMDEEEATELGFTPCPECID